MLTIPIKILKDYRNYMEQEYKYEEEFHINKKFEYDITDDKIHKH